MPSVTSAAFTDGGAIPSRHTCDGEDISPPLAWSGMPDGTAAVAILVTDPDAHDFVHWAAADIPPGDGTGGLAEGSSGSAAAGVEGRNGFGGVGWGGPCPPSGEHRYVFEVVALSDTLGLEPGFSERELRRRMAPAMLDHARLTARYRRGG